MCDAAQETVSVATKERKEIKENPTPADAWKHRARRMKCQTCMWYVYKSRLVPSMGDADRLGRCRRHAPTISGYPVVFEYDWCGDHKLDENKV